MYKLCFALVISLAVAHVDFAQLKRMASKKFSADTVRFAIDDITRELSLKHPGFYRYNSKIQFAHFIDSVKETIKDSLTEMQSYLKLKAIVTKINCLHTGISLPGAYKTFLNEHPNLLPVQLYFSNHRAWVVKNYARSKDILPGDEIISINGQDIATIIDQLLPLIPADGYNQTMKYRALYYQFPTWYRSIDLKESFAVMVRRNNMQYRFQIDGEKFNDIAEGGFLKEEVPPKQLVFKIEKQVGLLTIHSFANSEIKNAKQNFTKFIDSAFAELNADHVENLIVDLRDNTGGSDEYAAYFTRFFFDKPFRYWDRIEVTPAIAKEIKGLALKLYYRKPVYRDSVWQWQKARHVKDFDFYEVQQPAKDHYAGRTYILINGFVCHPVPMLPPYYPLTERPFLLAKKPAEVIKGNNSGMMPVTHITPFDFEMTVPLQKYINAVDPNSNMGRGTMPDYTVSKTIDDVLKKEDREMTVALGLIQKK